MLHSIELANFLSHNNTRLTFDKGVTIFVGPNGSGKSSIIDAITFALFGGHTRKSTKGLVQRGNNQAYAKVEFSIQNRQFEAVRKIDLKGTVSAQLYEKIDGDNIPLAAGERKQFGESMTMTIESLIGLDFEKLKVASIVQQGELQSIIETDPKKFKELINAIVGIDKLDKAYELMKKIIDEFRVSVKSRLDYDDTSIEILQKKIDSSSNEIASLEPQIKQLAEEKATQEQKIVILQKKVELEAPKELKIKEIEKRKEDLTKYLKNAITSIKKDILEKERKLANCSDSLSIISFKSQVEFEINQVQTVIEKIRTQAIETGEKIAKIRGQQEIAGRLTLIDGKCPVCNSRVDHLNPFFEERHLQDELEKLKKESQDLIFEEASLQNKKRDLDLQLQRIVKADSILSLNNIRNQDDLSILRKDLGAIQTSIKGIPPEINTSRNLMQYAIDEYSTDAIRSIMILIDETREFEINNFRNLKSELEQQRKILSTLDQNIGAVNTKLKLYREESEKILQVLEELRKVKQYVSSLETIRNQIYNRDGPVATSVRSWALGIISQKASEYLTTFNVKIQRISLQDKPRDIGINCYSGNSTLDLESLSGGEKVSVALALRLGMAHLMGSSNLNFIILDEPTIHLDQERRKSLVNVLTQAFESNIGAISQFIIITHDSEIFENSNIDKIYDFKSMPEGTLVTPI